MNMHPEGGRLRIAIMADEFDRRPERTLYFRRLIEKVLEEPEIELTLIHSHKMADEPLYARVQEILLPRIPLPFGTRFFSFLRLSLSTRKRYDILVWLMPRVFPLFWLFPARHQIVMTHGGGDVLVPGIWTFARTVFNATLILFQKKVSAMIAVSEFANKEIIYAYHVHPDKVRTIRNPVDPLYDHPPTKDAVEATRSYYDLADMRYFIYLGRFRLHKNVGHLVRSYLEYRCTFPETQELLVLGGGSKDEYVRTFGAFPDSPYHSDIRFLDYVPAEHLPGLYGGAVALVFVTLNEGFGLPVVEAMACGTPVITSSVTSLPEVAGDAGYIVDPTNVDELVTALYQVSHDDELRSGMRTRGFAHAKSFTWDRTLADWMKIFREYSGR